VGSAHDSLLWGGVHLARLSPPFRTVSYSSGGQGARRAEVMRPGWSPVPPGNDAKEMEPNETRFLEQPPPGPRRRYGPNGSGFEKNTPYLSLHQGCKSIIGAGVVIVLEFHTDFFPRGQLRGASDVVVPPSCRQRRSLTAWVQREGTFGRSWSSGHQLIGGDPR
jgi:hypothetical protein